MQNVLEIVSWYKKNLRPLPWRDTKDPYKIWLSEVILQQTQVVQGLQYYYTFIGEYPQIKDLAMAKEQDVLKLWQGLGYYSRARNLHKTAGIIHSEYQGVFPDSYEELIKLPGIGDYTASAILSFAFGKPYPALDGNVYRVLSRYYGIRLAVNDSANKPVFMEILNELIQTADPSDFNNAMMELGAMVCKPDNPACNACPVSAGCYARMEGIVGQLPLKKIRPPKKKRYFNFFYVRHEEQVYLQKRTENDIWKNMYQLPLTESDQLPHSGEQTQVLLAILKPNQQFRVVQHVEMKHILTHQEIYARFTELHFNVEPKFNTIHILKVNLDDVLKYPMPVLVEKFLLSL